MGRQICNCSIEEETRALLLNTLQQVEPLYPLEKEDGLDAVTRAAFFATSRLAAGAAALRGMIVDAWEDSATASVGYPMVNVRDIESGKVRAKRDLFGAD
jgi:hypothetical protein